MGEIKNFVPPEGYEMREPIKNIGKMFIKLCLVFVNPGLALLHLKKIGFWIKKRFFFPWAITLYKSLGIRDL